MNKNLKSQQLKNNLYICNKNICSNIFIKKEFKVGKPRFILDNIKNKKN
jgi:hypothetical protein